MLGIDAVNSDGKDRHIRPALHGAKLRSIENRMFGGYLGGIAFDLKGNVWVADGQQYSTQAFTRWPTSSDHCPT